MLQEHLAGSVYPCELELIFQKAPLTANPALVKGTQKQCLQTNPFVGNKETAASTEKTVGSNSSKQDSTSSPAALNLLLRTSMWSDQKKT